ncbi:hypothetical protein GCM10023193_26060 [Planotetraspora kaengkrachanensis]|uniref:Uncharacterized protein n=1 Tax=Planotetraspora kaengkrachanensis TaxID=575193 RepID=A0A8J3LX77_9ACTN|nr:hypothetical protein Pka01_14920 [Planotetraspora kaengkrachanensis]
MPTAVATLVTAHTPSEMTGYDVTSAAATTRAGRAPAHAHTGISAEDRTTTTSSAASTLSAHGDTGHLAGHPRPSFITPPTLSRGKSGGSVRYRRSFD